MIILILCIILFLLCTLVSGLRGIKSFAVLIYNSLILLLSIFLISLGINPLIIMFLSSVIFTVINLIYQNGCNIKTISSLFSVVSVLIIMSALIYYICLNSHISGLNEIQINEGNTYMNYAVKINMQQILITSIIWATLGATMDTSISISSSLNEIKANNTKISILSLFKSGMNVGKDILGTTVNTLIFVGFGESLMLIFFYIENNYTLIDIINLKSFFQELSTILISCISCILIIPITAFYFCIIIKYNSKKHIKQGIQ